MPDQLQLRGGTTAQHASFTGASKEVTVDTTKKTLVVHDGSTAGGNPLLREDQSNLPTTAPTRGIYNASGSLAISTGGSGRLFIDSAGVARIGASSTVGSGTVAGLQITHDTNGNGLRIVRATTNNSGPAITSLKCRGTALSPVTVQNGDVNLFLSGNVYDGTSWVETGFINSVTDVVAGADNVSGYLTFATRPTGVGQSSTERLRITSAGLVGVGVSAPSWPLDVNGVARSTGTSAMFALSDRSTGTGDRYGIYSNSNTFRVYDFTAAADRVVVDSLGRVGIGTTSPGTTLDVAGNQRFSAASPVLEFNNGGPQIFVPGANTLAFATGGGIGSPTERARIDSSGRLLVGTSSSWVSGANLQVRSAGNYGPLSLWNNGDDDTRGVYIFCDRARGSGTSALLNNDKLFEIVIRGHDGTTMQNAAFISAFVDGTPGAGDMPGRIVLSTTLDGASSPTERLRITNDGVQAYNQPAPTSKSAAATLTVAELKTGIIQYTGAAATLTLPTGTLTEGGFAGIYTNMTFEWSVINTGSGTCTIGAGTDHTIVGGATIAAGASGRFASRRTAANTFVSYRLS